MSTVWYERHYVGFLPRNSLCTLCSAASFHLLEAVPNTAGLGVKVKERAMRATSSYQLDMPYSGGWLGDQQVAESSKHRVEREWVDVNSSTAHDTMQPPAVTHWK